jgi:hypothetical protein
MVALIFHPVLRLQHSFASQPLWIVAERYSLGIDPVVVSKTGNQDGLDRRHLCPKSR